MRSCTTRRSVIDLRGRGRRKNRAARPNTWVLVYRLLPSCILILTFDFFPLLRQPQIQTATRLAVPLKNRQIEISKTINMSFNTITSIFRNDDSVSYTPLPTFSTQTSEKEPSSPPSESSSQFSSAYSTSSRGQIDPRTVSDVTLGLSDGLTVPFALTAGLAALGDTKIVVFAGMAEILAGSISMGIGGYLGASGEA
jgi:hypothetical protein